MNTILYDIPIKDKLNAQGVAGFQYQMKKVSITRTTGIWIKHFNLLDKKQFLDDLFMIVFYILQVFSILRQKT